MNDKDIIKAFDILEKFDFFYGQRAGRELWNKKPVDVQDKDIKTFSNDVAFLKDFIKRQQAEIERLKKDIGKDFTCFVGDPHKVDNCPYLEQEETARAEAIKEFWERLTNIADTTQVNAFQYAYVVREEDADAIIKEMVGDEQ